MFESFLFLCELFLFLSSITRIYKYFLRPCYYHFNKKYKTCFLKNKYIEPNINRQEKKNFIHWFFTIETCVISITLYPFLSKLYIAIFGHDYLFWFNFFYIIYVFLPAIAFIVYLISTKLKRKFKENKYKKY
ncbi:hypothetical protein ['Cynodon dactylon' phytoplasma]|uniref:hypothetical protein n=1 Tax='Cynodon dactylon' phytoplasma TaxID=295320 RepID=UPI001265CDB8|nr:hypothetical protein ['Cynodon dactylon' phytoplasma]KAB8121756.1 hypothetical protein F1741_01805 ['Cynodon dactylon' phytoplasma]